MKNSYPQIILSSENLALINNIDEIIIENVFNKYKLSKSTKKKISLI